MFGFAPAGLCFLPAEVAFLASGRSLSLVSPRFVPPGVTSCRIVIIALRKIASDKPSREWSVVVTGFRDL